MKRKFSLLLCLSALSLNANAALVTDSVERTAQVSGSDFMSSDVLNSSFSGLGEYQTNYDAQDSDVSDGIVDFDSAFDSQYLCATCTYDFSSSLAYSFTIDEGHTLSLAMERDPSAFSGMDAAPGMMEISVLETSGGSSTSVYQASSALEYNVYTGKQDVQAWLTSDGYFIAPSRDVSLNLSAGSYTLLVSHIVDIDTPINLSGVDTFSVDASLAQIPVPVPAALWLFLSALAGLRLAKVKK